MDAEATALLKLQEIDLALMRAEAQLRAMPQAEKLARVAKAKKKLSSELTRIIGTRKDIEIDIEDIQEQHERYERDRAEAKATISDSNTTYKEIQALDAKLSSIAKQLEKLEFKLGPLLEKLDEAKAGEGKLRAIGAKLIEEETALRDSFAADSAQTCATIENLKEDREDILVDISEEMQAAYAAAQKRFSGLAVERLTGNVPSTCRVKLATDTYQILVKGPSITTCPYCHRMLVVEGL